jgi:hypothetical protein
MSSGELQQIGTTKRIRCDDIQYEILVYADPGGFHAVWRCECRMAGRSDGSSPTTAIAIDAVKVHLQSHHSRRHAENQTKGD